MPTAVRSLVQRLKGFWDAFTVPQRTFALIALVALAAGIVALAGWLTKPTMSAVYTDLSDTDAAAVVAQLDSDGIEYQLAAGGTTVLVPSDQVDNVRLELAANGIPSDSDGYALLDQMGVGASEFQQEVTYQRAVEGELASTISSIDGVSSATVHLAVPEESVYTEEKADTTASVFLELKPGATFSGESVRAVTNLVSSSVPNLDPSDVSVVDDQGRDLTLTASDATGAASDRDTAIASKVQAMLDQVLGSGRSTVTVSTDVNTDSTERTSETYSAADDVPPLSSSKSTESYTGTGGNAGGVLGTDNIAVPDSQSGAGNYSSEEETVNNSVNKVTEQTTVSPGGVRRQSVSVVVDRAAAAGLSDATLNEMVAAAAGIDEDRGDTLSVVKADFDASAAQQADDALAQQQAAEEEARRDRVLIAEIAGAIAVLVLLGVALALRVRRRRRRREELDEQEYPLEEDLASGPALPPEEADGDESDLVRTSVLTPQHRDPEEQMRTDIAELAEKDPAAVASTLGEWLAVHK
jgi:flagellar M-ring protein FliF